jgi:nucleotide-binding universal stress UspA family protein
MAGTPHTDVSCPTPSSATDLAETTELPTKPIVVGVDFSDCSQRAAYWAAAEATQLNAPLRLVHAYTLPVSGYPGSYPIPDLAGGLRAVGRALLDETEQTLHRAYPEVHLTTVLAHGDPAKILERESRDAYLTVVGAGHTGRLTNAVLGSVALTIASTGSAPVAVIHQNDSIDGVAPIVVAVDGTPTSDEALAFAFEFAAASKADLIALQVSWFDSAVDAAIPALRLVVDPLEVVSKEWERLAEQVASWHEKYPDVAVKPVVKRGRATPLLLQYSRGARLMVVGSRGLGGFAGMFIGSTSHALVAKSWCPVIVVRAKPPRAWAGPMKHRRPDLQD